MKRFHVHVAVDDLQRSVSFYSTLFGAEPTVIKSDYAKWMLDEPRVNFAISARGQASGIRHLGIQVEENDELNEVRERLKKAEGPVVNEGATACCYAQSEKAWIADPTGIAWETFLTIGENTTYGHGVDSDVDERLASAACCEPQSGLVQLSGSKRTVECRDSSPSKEPR